MVSEVQYGGKITDDLDRRMFKTYTQVTTNEFSSSLKPLPDDHTMSTIRVDEGSVLWFLCKRYYCVTDESLQ